jgi:hypothetical protein
LHQIACAAKWYQLKTKRYAFLIIYCIAANRLAESFLSRARFLLLRRATFCLLHPPPLVDSAQPAGCAFFCPNKGLTLSLRDPKITGFSRAAAQ